LNKFQKEEEKDPETLKREQELAYCTISMDDHIKAGEMA
jgi:hypothetical protein